MTLATILKILGGLAAFAYGIWAGLGQFRQSQDEIDRALTKPGRRRKATRHFTPLDLMAKMTGVPTQRERRTAFRFQEKAQGEGRSTPQERVDRDQDSADEGAQEVSEPDDHP